MAGLVRWIHDPSDLVPSVPPDPFSALALAADESALHARPDVVALASSDYPNFVPHPGTDENPWLAVSGKRTTQSLSTGRDHASYVTLTVLASPSSAPAGTLQRKPTRPHSARTSPGSEDCWNRTPPWARK